MIHDPTTSGAPAREGLTITQVLKLDRRVSLYGARISDLSPRGDLGLGLDPEGPIGFALIRGYRRNGQFTRLRNPIVLSVFGDGRPGDLGDTDAQVGERTWLVALADRAFRLELQQGGIAVLLDESAADR